MTDPPDDPSASEGLTPEQREQVDEALVRARGALATVSKAGCLGFLLRGVFRSAIPRPRLGRRFRRRGVVYFGLALLVALLSVTTCSAGVTLETLTAEYGRPVATSRAAAQRFLVRAGAGVQSAGSSQRLRITMSEVEATSVLSFGMMIPELMRAVESVSPEDMQAADDVESLRELMRRREMATPPRTFGERVGRALDPRLRTGDVQVRFTPAGEMVVAGYVHAWRWRQPALVVFAPRASAGELELDFVKGRLGRLPAPAFAFDLLGRLVSSLILQGRDYAEISNLTISDGRFTFEAVVK